MSEPISQGDLDPAEWSDPVATYDLVAPRYAERFVGELDHKPFDRALLERFAARWRPVAADLPVCDLGCGPGHIGAYLAGQE